MKQFAVEAVGHLYCLYYSFQTKRNTANMKLRATHILTEHHHDNF